MPEKGPHTEMGLKPKLSPRLVPLRKRNRNLCTAAQAADEIPTTSLVNPASVEYLNGK